MQIRSVVFLSLLLLFVSCDFFSFSQRENSQAIDTVIDFSKVDTSPSFSNCKNLIEEAKLNCFRRELQKRITRDLLEYSFSSEESINEKIFIYLIIDEKGNFKLEEISSTEVVEEEFPELDSILKTSIKKLPRITPGVKRGVPVRTQYQLPIKISNTL